MVTCPSRGLSHVRAMCVCVYVYTYIHVRVCVHACLCVCVFIITWVDHTPPNFGDFDDIVLNLRLHS